MLFHEKSAKIDCLFLPPYVLTKINVCIQSAPAMTCTAEVHFARSARVSSRINIKVRMHSFAFIFRVKNKHHLKKGNFFFRSTIFVLLILDLSPHKRVRIYKTFHFPVTQYPSKPKTPHHLVLRASRLIHLDAFAYCLAHPVHRREEKQRHVREPDRRVVSYYIYIYIALLRVRRLAVHHKAAHSCSCVYRCVFICMNASRG